MSIMDAAAGLTLSPIDPSLPLPNLPSDLPDSVLIHNQKYPRSPILDTPEEDPDDFAVQTLSMSSTKPIEFWRKLIPNFNKILDHGCWCSSLIHNKFPNTEPLDQLDSICHSWAVCRRCTRDTDTACNAGWAQTTNITEVDNFKYKCTAADDCTNGLCRCNMNFVVEISEFFNDYFQSFTDVFEPDVVDRQRCGVPEKDTELFNIHLDDVKDQTIFQPRSSISQPSSGSFDLDPDTFDFGDDPEPKGHVEVPLDTEKLLNSNDFFRSFGFIDQQVKEKVKTRVPTSMRVSKRKIKRIQELDDSEKHSRGPGLSINRRNEELMKIFGDPIDTGKKCCGHAPHFRLYNPNTDFCDEENS